MRQLSRLCVYGGVEDGVIKIKTEIAVSQVCTENLILNLDILLQEIFSTDKIEIITIF